MNVLKNKTLMQWISFLLVLLSFPLLNYGVREMTVLAWIGMAMVVLGFLIPPVLRLATSEEDGDSGEEDGGEES